MHGRAPVRQPTLGRRFAPTGAFCGRENVVRVDLGQYCHLARGLNNGMQQGVPASDNQGFIVAYLIAR